MLEGSEVAPENAFACSATRGLDLLMLSRIALHLHRSIDIDIDEAAIFEEYLIIVIVGIV